MAATAEAIRHELRDRVRGLAEPIRAGESVQALIHRVARRAGLQAGQVKRLWYEEWAVVPAHVADTLRALDLERERVQAEKGALHDEIDRLLVASLAPDPAGPGAWPEHDRRRLQRRRGDRDSQGSPAAAGVGAGG